MKKGYNPRPHRATIYRAGDGWRYRIKAGNGRIVRASEQAFSRPTTCKRRIEAEFPKAIVTVEA